MKTRWLLGLFLWLSAMACQAESELRTWTDVEGRTMKARFIEMRQANVFFKLEDGQYAEVPLLNLSEADRKHIQEQLEAQKPVAKLPEWNAFQIKSQSQEEDLLFILQGKYRQDGDLLIVDFSEVAIASKSDLSRTRIYGRPMVIQPFEGDAPQWWRGRKFESRDSDGELEMAEVVQSGGYSSIQLEEKAQRFHLYIAHWARRDDVGRLSLVLELDVGRTGRFYLPIANVKFPPKDQ